MNIRCKVERINTRGFAFCKSDTHPRSYFLHATQFNGDWDRLGEGDEVEGEVRESRTHTGKYELVGAKLAQRSDNAPEALPSYGMSISS